MDSRRRRRNARAREPEGPPRSQRVLVVGASGTIGTQIASELMARGWWVRAMTRDPRGMTADVDEIFVADLRNPVSMRGVCDEVDFVFSCAGASPKPVGMFASKYSFPQIDDFGNRNLLAAAEQAGVRRFGYLGVSGGKVLGSMEYIRAHESFSAALRRAEVNPLVVRSNSVFASLTPVLRRAARGQVRLLQDGDARVNPIHEQELAVACVDALVGHEEEIEIGGPEILTRRRIAELAFEALGTDPKIRNQRKELAGLGMRVTWLRGRHNYDVAQFDTFAQMTDLIAPAHGSRTIADYFAELAQAEEA